MMVLVRSTLLGSAIALGAVAQVAAADQKKGKVSPVEYVRVCAEHGAGFFHIPGSDACIHIGGRVRVGALYVQTRDRNRDTINLAANARVNFDIRQNTPYGMARAFLRFTHARTGSNFGSSFNNGFTGQTSASSLDSAYIQFAGVTAGRIKSFFDYYADNNNFALIRSSDVTNQVLAYTFDFGQGWSLTASLEDGNERRVYANPTFSAATGVDPAGQTVPDVVGALLVDQGWGSAQISTALHQIRPAFGGVVAGPRSTPDTDYGFAVHAGFKLNLPTIAPGDEFWVEGAYADGALGYIGARNYSLGQGGIGSLPMTDAFFGVDGRFEKTKGWSVLASFLHYWTPSIRQNVFASYMQLLTGRNGYTTIFSPTLGTYNEGFIDTGELRVGSNLIWSPIKNFDIGVEAIYTHVDPKGRVLSDNNGALKTVSSSDAWQGRLRFQRAF